MFNTKRIKPNIEMIHFKLWLHLIMIIRLSFLEQAKNDLFELLATGSATNADAANILLSRINKDCESLLGLHCPCLPLNT